MTSRGHANDGRGACYVEFGSGLVGRVDVDFLSCPKPKGTLQAPSYELVAATKDFGASRRARWFGYWRPAREISLLLDPNRPSQRP